jgi:hypothetical protein
MIKKLVSASSIFLVSIAILSGFCAEPPQMKFLFALGSPESLIEFAQPQRVFLDFKHDEYYITDTGHNRIVIFDQRGFPTFEISNSEKLQFPLDLVVDSSGFIFVLCGSSKEQPIQIFDYNGDYLHPLVLSGGPDPKSITIASMAIDEKNYLYLADGVTKRVLIYDCNGLFHSEFSLLNKQMVITSQSEIEFGTIFVNKNVIYVTIPMNGAVYCFSPDGTLLKTVGSPGDGFGELSFPIAVSLDTTGNILVLDKHRHKLIQYDQMGKATAEYGGLGVGPGWFYHPISLLIDKQNRVWVAQGLNNLVQVLQLPNVDEPATLTEEEKSSFDRHDQ